MSLLVVNSVTVDFRWYYAPWQQSVSSANLSVPLLSAKNDTLPLTVCLIPGERCISCCPRENGSLLCVFRSINTGSNEKLFLPRLNQPMLSRCPSVGLCNLSCSCRETDCGSMAAPVCSNMQKQGWASV